MKINGGGGSFGVTLLDWVGRSNEHSGHTVGLSTLRLAEATLTPANLTASSLAGDRRASSTGYRVRRLLSPRRPGGCSSRIQRGNIS